jgi:hypothetical protein
MKKGKRPPRVLKIIYPLVPLLTPVSCHWIVPLKGQYHEFFEVWFFHQTTPPDPTRGVLEPFKFLLNFRGFMYIWDTRELWFSGVPDAGEAKISGVADAGES